MKPTFTLFHVENVNACQDSICHIILVPVVEGEIKPLSEYFVNPKTSFEYVTSGITREQVEGFDPLEKVWPSIRQQIDEGGFLISSAEGYSARSLYGTLERLGIEYGDLTYCNAKAICRKTFNEVSYSLNYLSYKIFEDTVYDDEPCRIAVRWAELVVKGLMEVASEDVSSFISEVRIKPGLISKSGFESSLTVRDYSSRKANAFNADNVQVNAREENPFFGMNVVFTGKLEAMTRDQARTLVTAIGGIAPDRLTKDTNYLVVGCQDLRVVGESGLSGKMKKAAEYKAKGCEIEIIDELDFIEMINQ